MYNLIVSNRISEEGPNIITLDRRRFLEYTSTAASLYLSSLSIEAIDGLKSWPCLTMEEGRAGENAFVRRIDAISLTNGDMRIATSPVPLLQEITNEQLWKLRDQLDIGEFEFARNHWSVKERDLWSVLRTQALVAPEIVASFSAKPVPAISRAELLNARMAIAELGHTDIDDFLLELGVPDLKAGRDAGSRRDRAIRIITYALDHPGATTADNHLLSAAILRRAGQSPLSQGDAISAVGPVVSNPPHSGEPQLAAGARSPNRVFVVHGRNDAARNKVMALLEGIGLIGIVLHEQPNMGRHLLTKFIDEADLVTFAIVLLTDDDFGGNSKDTLHPRARQNVILELGYFLAHLGQERVCAIKTPGLETPSDFDGIVYISMDHAGNWEAELMRELRAAGMPLKS